jgi:hypothetical protein
MLNINITESAQKYLAELLEKQDTEGIGIRVFVSDLEHLRLKLVLLIVVPAKRKKMMLSLIILISKPILVKKVYPF